MYKIQIDKKKKEIKLIRTFSSFEKICYFHIEKFE